MLFSDAPICTLVQENTNNDCRDITLTCNCTAAPPEITEYIFFNNSNLLETTNLNIVDVIAGFGTESVFSCTATNEVDNGSMSDGVNHVCEEGKSDDIHYSINGSTRCTLFIPCLKVKCFFRVRVCFWAWAYLCNTNIRVNTIPQVCSHLLNMVNRRTTRFNVLSNHVRV